MRKKVLVLGTNFAGLTAALAVRHELDGDVDVTVVSPDRTVPVHPQPDLAAVRQARPDDITFDVVPTLEDHGIEFVHAAATAVDPVAHQVTLDDGQVLGYDYLVIATGYRNKTDVVPGFTENAVTITTLAEAERTALAWQQVPGEPGRRGRRRDPGRRLLRRGVRVPLQHLLPAAQGRAAQGRQAHLRHRRAVPRPLRHRRAAARRGRCSACSSRRRASTPGSRRPSTTSTTARSCSGTARCCRSPSAWSSRRSSARSS